MKNIAFQGLTCTTVKLEVARCNRSEDLGVLLLESDPNPGYYSKQNFPPNKKPNADRHCYLLVKNSVNCFQDIILRETRELAKKFKHSVHISPGQMTFKNKNYQGVRINTTEVDLIPELIIHLNKLGIKFMPDQKVKKYNSIIFFKKYINFIKLQEGVYQDADVPARYFFTIPKQIEYSEFEHKMELIKNNCDFHLFDFFMSHFMLKDKVQDFVGIYSEHCDKNRFDELKKSLSEKFA